MPKSGEFHPSLLTTLPGRQSQRYGLCLGVALWTRRKIMNIYDGKTRILGQWFAVKQFAVRVLNTQSKTL